MSDDNVREIQLGGKQLVFLFMTAVVLAVAIFLLGISVGRGIGAPVGETASATDVPVADPMAPADMPPATETTPADLGYHDALQGQAPPPPAEPPAPVSDSAGQSAAADPASAAVKTPAVAPAAAKPAASATDDSWFVQVGAFKSRQNADAEARQLRAKGHTVVVLADPGSLFRVRIGPFADRAEADRTALRVRKEEGSAATVLR